jgi:hypothetical protein
LIAINAGEFALSQKDSVANRGATMARLLKQAFENRKVADELRRLAPGKSLDVARQSLLRYAQVLEEEAVFLEGAAAHL